MDDGTWGRSLSYITSEYYSQSYICVLKDAGHVKAENSFFVEFTRKTVGFKSS